MNWETLMHQKFILGEAMPRKYWSGRNRWIKIPICRWISKIVRIRPRIPRSHFKAGKLVRSEDLRGELQWGSQRRPSRRTGMVSTDRNKTWRWSPKRRLVDTGWLHLSPSQWPSSSTPYAERRNIPCSTEIHGCYEVNKYSSGRSTRETH